MKHRLIELIQNFADGTYISNGIIVDGTRVDDVADYLLSSGVIVPPCKVGDTVYVIFKDKIYKATVYSMNIETEQNHYLFLVKVKVFDQISMFKVFIFGKTVFPTKEEAEQTLKGGAE